MYLRQALGIVGKPSSWWVARLIWGDFVIFRPKVEVCEKKWNVRQSESRLKIFALQHWVSNQFFHCKLILFFKYLWWIYHELKHKDRSRHAWLPGRSLNVRVVAFRGNYKPCYKAQKLEEAYETQRPTGT
jgi:hypothetical protein